MVYRNANAFDVHDVIPSSLEKELKRLARFYSINDGIGLEREILQSSICTRGFEEFGLKVYLDAHVTITHETRLKLKQRRDQKDQTKHEKDIERLRERRRLFRNQ